MKVLKVSKKDYTYWIKDLHYAKRMPSISFAYGLFINEKMSGVCTFGMPPSSTLSKSICGENYKHNVIELNRLITLDNLPKNTLSKFLSKSLKLLPKPKIVVSFADPNNYHTGYIYQATNFIYTGDSENQSQWVDKNDKEFHFRNIGHYQKNNALKVPLVKRRINEDSIDKRSIANYLRANKNNITAKELDNFFGYKDTAAHWFRTDDGFSFPSVDDWKKIKNILNFDDKYDDIMTAYKMIPCPNEIVKKLQLRKKNILGKHRYVFICANKQDKKNILKSFLLPKLPYPKGTNKNYEVNYIQTQKNLF
jgi:hypothetical protein